MRDFELDLAKLPEPRDKFLFSLSDKLQSRIFGWFPSNPLKAPEFLSDTAFAITKLCRASTTVLFAVSILFVLSATILEVQQGSLLNNYIVCWIGAMGFAFIAMILMLAQARLYGDRRYFKEMLELHTALPQLPSPSRAPYKFEYPILYWYYHRLPIEASYRLRNQLRDVATQNGVDLSEKRPFHKPKM